MDNLNYHAHLAHYRQLFNIDGESSLENVRFSSHEAQRSHALAVFDPLRDWQLKAIQISERLEHDRAKYYMRYGAARRFGMLFFAFRDIIYSIEPSRTEPLAHEDEQRLSLSINVLYLHVRGVLDNFAWAFISEKHPDRAATINPQRVSIFDSKFRKECPSFSVIAPAIDQHLDWMQEVKSRRDPVAHRIPLSIPQGELDQGEFAAYEKLLQQHIDRAADGDFKGAGNAFTAAGRLGRFIPCFLHNPEEAPIPLYPTVPSDMAHLIKIGDIIEGAI